MAIVTRSNADIQRARGILEVKCRYGCGKAILITSTTTDKTVVLEKRNRGDFMINESEQAVWVGEGGDYGFHRCPELDEIY